MPTYKHGVSKKDFERKVADAAGVSYQDTKMMIDVVFNTIADLLAEGKEVAIYKFGTFRLNYVKALACMDLYRNERTMSPAHYRLKFKPSTSLKERIKDVPLREEDLMREEAEEE